MSIPILYDSDVTNFSNNGIGFLSDCISCEVTEEANGIFELSMKYPCDGIHFDSIQNRCIIKAKADQFRVPQLFRVYSKTKNISGIATILAEHISYDLSGIVVSPFSAESVGLALAGFKNNAVVDCPFDFWTDKDTSAKFSVAVPSSIRSRLGGYEGSILDVYGGELEFDNTTVRLYNNRGRDRGVSIRYGKNLTDFKQEENCSSIYTGVYPYWVDVETNEVFELSDKIVNAPGTYNFVKIKAVDFSADFEEKPTEEQLRAKAEKYVKDNEIGVPSVSMSVSFVQLEQTEEYKHLKILERVSLFDTVSVVFPALNVSTKAKAVKVVYDSLQDKVKTVTLGKIRANISDTVAKQEKEIANAPTKTDLEKAKEAATAWLTNGKGYKVERRDEAGRTIDTLYMDSPDIETAVNVLRIGNSGIGFSNNGVSGPYTSAWTLDGKFNADFITTGTLLGLVFKAGIIESLDGKIGINLQNGKAAKFNSGIESNGIVVKPKDYNVETMKVATATNTMLNDSIPYAYLRMKNVDNSEIFSVDHTFVVDENGSNHRIGETYARVNNGDSYVRMVAGDGFSDLDLVSSDGCYFGVRAVSSDTVFLNLPSGIHQLYWKSSGGGTYTLMGK